MSVEERETTSLIGTWITELPGKAYLFVLGKTTAKSSKIHCKMFLRVAELATSLLNFCRFL